MHAREADGDRIGYNVARDGLGGSMRMVMWLVLAGACVPDTVGERIINDDEEIDTEGPAIDHQPVTSPMPFEQDVLIEATITDESDVFTAEIVYRQETAGNWTTVGMNAVGGGFYQGTIPGRDVYSGGMLYFLRATDMESNTSCEPEDCEPDAWRFPVTAF